MDSPTPPPHDDNDPSPLEAPPAASGAAGSPTDFLKGVVGKKVIVRLISGVDYRGACFFFSPLFTTIIVDSQCLTSYVGVLSCLDGYMNIALEQTEEHVNGRVTNRYGDTFIRGNNGALQCQRD